MILSGLHCRHTGGSLQPQYQGENSRGMWLKQKVRANRPKTGILLENKFAPLLQDPDSPKERSSSSTGERCEAKSYTKRLQKELTTGPQTLIVGDGAVNKTKHFFSKNTKVLCFTNDMVSDISEKILEITAEHPTVKSVVIHTGALDVVKQQSEVLKRDFNDLLNNNQRY
ncbi:hypothetical protein N1851_002412 [Merluccius polli]|uniref:Uncharacterized protein n=1 Tax=Merluccius polli TaxID=89951 RepID=A0AA47NAG7_MERPO|nr:hypothetical protein N1851_002412 [Merluccius polli]